MGTACHMPPHLASLGDALYLPLTHTSTLSQSQRNRLSFKESSLNSPHKHTSDSRYTTDSWTPVVTHRSAQASSSSRSSTGSNICLNSKSPTIKSKSPASIPHLLSSHSASKAAVLSTSRPPTMTEWPEPKQPQSNNGDSSGTSRRSSAMVLHSLQIPTCIDPRGGNLADFLTEITKFMWFESTNVLSTAENVRLMSPNAPIRRLSPATIACANYKKWAHSILSTTQVTQNVILLALLFIYRLKTTNLKVKGRPGSEYRLLTVALMLGNKFLDDNTYTNKTWAEVSGIPVGDVHVMEVEFLSNMRYNLLVSSEEWEEWLIKLAKFGEYYERAKRAPPEPVASPTCHSHSGTANGINNSPLPSPTSSWHVTANGQQTPTSARVQATSANAYNMNPTPADWTWSLSSPMKSSKPPILGDSRKRNSPVEDELSEPPPKRTWNPTQLAPTHIGPQPAQRPPSLPTLCAPSVPAPDACRLSVPELTIRTGSGTAAAPSSVMPPAPNYAAQSATSSTLSLPPPRSRPRVLATVFPLTTNTPFSTCPSSAAAVAAATPTSQPPASFGTPTKRTSPQHSWNSAAMASYAAVSPLSDHFPPHAMTPAGSSTSGLHTPISHSPSVYLQQRTSPYRPIRGVSTLLYPPPSAFLQQYHICNPAQPAQMHYQPLGQRHEYRTGVVPEFAMAGSASDPNYGNLPVTRQRLMPVQGAGHMAPIPGSHAASTYPQNAPMLGMDTDHSTYG